ncbi:hypothetical protein Q9189_001871 [Teloschistes chrysophthalmus]
MTTALGDLPGLAVRQVLVTADNKGPQINVVAWTCMVVMILAVGTRLAIKYNAFRRFGLDDALVAVAMVLAIGQATAVSLQVSNGGLGQPISTLTDSEVASFEKGQYAADMLYIAALAFSKFSSIAYMIQFTPDHRHRLWGKVILAAVATWAVVAFFGVAFECGVPSPWAIVNGKCMNVVGLLSIKALPDPKTDSSKTAFWEAMGAIDILTDFALIALPSYITWHLQMARKHKVAVTIAFGCRIILPPIVILRLIYLDTAFTSDNQTFYYRRTVFCMLADVNASVLVACIPFLKPFMQGLESGLLTSDLRVRGPTKSLFANLSSDMEVGKGRKDNGYPLNRISGNKSKSGISRHPSRSNGRFADEPLGHRVNIHHQPPDRDFESRTSTGSDKMIIKQTTEFNVVHDGVPSAL